MKLQFSSVFTGFVTGMTMCLLVGSPVLAKTYSDFSYEKNSQVQADMIIKVYNEDQFRGNWKQLKGALKENWGEFTDDDLLAIEGRVDRFEGKVQERYGERKEEVREWVDNYLENHPYDSQHDKVHN